MHVPNKIIFPHGAADGATCRYTPASGGAGNDSIADLELPTPTGDATTNAHSAPRAIVERHRAPSAGDCRHSIAAVGAADGTVPDLLPYLLLARYGLVLFADRAASRARGLTER